MVRQAFSEFLESGPSTSRGRGRGRGGTSERGGRGSPFRGGFTPSRGRGGSFTANFTSVGFNYDNLNARPYSRVESINNGPDSGPSTPPFRGRGRGRGAYDSQSSRGARGGIGRGRGTSSTPLRLHAPASGTATPGSGADTPGPGAFTPVTGLGYGRRAQHGAQTPVSRGGGHGEVTWGGGMAPLFVKAGELFKDGEADVIKLDADGTIEIEVMPMDDPSAPQMGHLADEHEVDIVRPGLAADLSIPDVGPLSIHDATELGTGVAASDVVRSVSSELDALAVEAAIHVEAVFAPSAPNVDTVENAIEEPASTFDAEQDAFGLEAAIDDDGGAAAPLFFVDTTGAMPDAADNNTAPAQADASAIDALFFVDDQGTADAAIAPIYETAHTALLGANVPADSDDEEIVVRPRTFAEPEPMALPVVPHATAAAASASRPAVAAHALPRETRIFVSEAAMAKASAKLSKKEAKRDKRGRNKRAKRAQGARRPELMTGSDVEWGSDDGPDIIDVVMPGADVDALDSDDEAAIMRDYMRGTARRDSDDDDEADPDVDLEDLRRFGERMDKIGRENNVVDMFGVEEEVEEEEDDDDDDEGLAEDASSEDSDSEWGSGSESSELDIDVLQGKAKGKQKAVNPPRPIGFMGPAELVDFSASVEYSGDEALARALQEADDDEVDDEDMFNVKDDWGHTAWFLNSLEDALDPITMQDRKARNKVFRAVQNGDFDDDGGWGLTPRGKKNKAKHVPAAFQEQWERDRQKKAEKKKERELLRLLAEIEPSLRTSRGKGKKAKLDKAALASVAHLLPASASTVAELFDIPSDVDAAPRGYGKGGRKAVSLLPKTMAQVDQDVRTFIGNDGQDTMNLAPMDKEGRKRVHMLAEAYGLKSKSRGAGVNRFTVIIKTSRTGQAIDSALIERLVTSSASGGAIFKAGKLRDGGGGGKKKGKLANGNSAAAKLRDGETVGGGAERITTSNIGHQLLSRMGWSEGDRIGRSGGLDAPIVAIVKNTKSGLGA